VDYGAIQKDPDFKFFVQSLATATTANLTKNETYALFINAYNALAIKMVIDHSCQYSIFGKCEGPIASITDIGIKGTVWLKQAGTVGGLQYSLEQIESFLRTPAPYAEDPRLHACIVCASISCPNVRREAFRAGGIDRQMDESMTDMLSNRLKGLALNKTSMTVTLSKIFDWYASDFEKAAGDVLGFILPYLSDDDQLFISQHRDRIQVAYFDYDWDTNGAPPCNCTNLIR